MVDYRALAPPRMASSCTGTLREQFVEVGRLPEVLEADEDGPRPLRFPHYEHVRKPTMAFPGGPSRPVIDFGSAGQARSARLSPSTTSSGLKRWQYRRS
jgi:hypothetical protein